jgi:GH25 family lysozyme M1 (1,4-beta-N-acetylmuramidase)
MSLILPNALIVDISHWNPMTEAQFAEAKAKGGLVGCIAKIVQAGHADDQAVNNLRNAKAAGIELIGAYDFGTATQDAQAFLADVLADLGAYAGSLLVIDAESNPSSQMTVAGMEEWADEVAAAELRRPVSYMGRFGPENNGAGLPSATLSKGDLWLPAYGPHANNLGSILPPGFRLPTSDTDTGGCLRLWQFTGDGINAPDPWPEGIPPKCDLSYAIGFSSVEALAKWWKGV